MYCLYILSHSDFVHFYEGGKFDAINILRDLATFTLCILDQYILTVVKK